MKKSELKALILECKQELTEEAAQSHDIKIDSFIGKLQRLKKILSQVTTLVESTGGTISKVNVGNDDNKFATDDVQSRLSISGIPEDAEESFEADLKKLIKADGKSAQEIIAGGPRKSINGIYIYVDK